jgi:hypothetical protein
VSGPSGNANLAIPIAGPKAKATIYVQGVKSVGQWSFPSLVVEIEIIDQLELLDLAEAHEPRCLQGAAKLAGKETNLPDAVAPKRTTDATGLGSALLVEIALNCAIPEIDTGRFFKDAGRVGVAHEHEMARLL